MQKIINVIALLSGVVSLSVVGGGVYLYLNAGTIIETTKEKAVEEITAALPRIVEGLMPEVPELPKATGGAIAPMPSTPSVTGPAVPF
tara:strand:- start:777 stop:1040 length:264 start_codon:yes stop_codon:yes gene_type:complete